MTTVFNQNAYEYDKWFDEHPNLYQSELLALKQVVPERKKGIEIGVGTGRFAAPLNIKFGVEPSDAMAKIARHRGVKTIKAEAEHLPIKNESFEFVTMITTVCFLHDIPAAFSEVFRILKTGGSFIIGLIDRESDLGRKYQQQKETNKFYKDAHLHSVGEIAEILEKTGFQSFSYQQTLLSNTENSIEPPRSGYGSGGFVVIEAKKQR